MCRWISGWARGCAFAWSSRDIYSSFTKPRETLRDHPCFTSHATGIPPGAVKKTNTQNMKAIITTFGVLALAASLAIAQDKPPGGKPPGGRPGGPGGPEGEHKRPSPEEVFKKLDANSDGAISLDEFKAGPRAQQDPSKAEEHFKKIDKDGNGSVNLDEFKAGRPPGGPGKDGPGGGRPPGGKPPGGKPPGGPKPE